MLVRCRQSRSGSRYVWPWDVFLPERRPRRFIQHDDVREIPTPATSPEASIGRGIIQLIDAPANGFANAEIDYPTDSLTGIDVLQCRAKLQRRKYIGTQNVRALRGIGWLDAAIGYTGINTINPPNGASCHTPTTISGGTINTAGSYHPGGAHVVMFDAATKFVTDDIDTSHPTSTNPADYYAPGRATVGGVWQQTPNWSDVSPFGVWGAMGLEAEGRQRSQRNKFSLSKTNDPIQSKTAYRLPVGRFLFASEAWSSVLRY